MRGRTRFPREASQHRDDLHEAPRGSQEGQFVLGATNEPLGVTTKISMSKSSDKSNVTRGPSKGTVGPTPPTVTRRV